LEQDLDSPSASIWAWNGYLILSQYENELWVTRYALHDNTTP
jgi:hypothetical protein